MAGRKPYDTTEHAEFDIGSRRLKPPDCLGELQRRAFIDLVGSCPISQFRKSDLPLLARWSELVVLCETAAFHLQGGGAVEDGKASPWVAIHRDSSEDYSSNLPKPP